MPMGLCEAPYFYKGREERYSGCEAWLVFDQEEVADVECSWTGGDTDYFPPLREIATPVSSSYHFGLHDVFFFAVVPDIQCNSVFNVYMGGHANYLSGVDPQ